LLESKATFENSAQNMKQDLKRVRDEWERRCKDEELNHQHQLSDQQTKHQVQITQIQQQYQAMLDQKLLDIQTESNNQLNKTKQHESEMKATLEEKLFKIEKEHVTKEFHEATLLSNINQIK